MITLALRLQDDFPRHYPLFATRTFTYNGETFRNHNTLLFSYEGSDGLKTGYTRASGFNLVASVRRGRKHVVGAVFGGATASLRNAAMRTYLNIGLMKASEREDAQAGAAPRSHRPSRRPAMHCRTGSAARTAPRRPAKRRRPSSRSPACAPCWCLERRMPLQHPSRRQPPTASRRCWRGRRRAGAAAP